MVKNISQSLGYCRVSTTKQVEDGHGLERYIQDLKDYGLPEDQIYWDVLSGNRNDRRGYNQILKLIKSGEYKYLVVPNFERFTRSPLHWEQELQELIDQGVTLIYLEGGTNKLETPDDILNTRIRVAFAAMTRDRIRYNAIQGMRYLMSQEKALQAIFGYKKVEENLIINHDEYKGSGKSYSDVALEMIETYLTTRSLAGTTRIINNKYGFEYDHSKSEPGHPISHGGFRKWLRHPLLRGHLVYYNYNSNKKQIIPDKFERLISEKTYTQICTVLDNHRKNQRKKSTLSNPLLGLCICAGCGGNMKVVPSRYTNKYGEKRVFKYVVCSNAYPDPSKPVTCDRRTSYGLLMEDCIKQVINALCNRAEQIAKQVIVQEQPKVSTPEIDELKAQIARLIALDDSDLTEAIGIKQAKLENLILDLNKNNLSSDTSGKLEILKEYASRWELWEMATLEELYVLFQDLVKRVTCDQGVVTVDLLV